MPPQSKIAWIQPPTQIANIEPVPLSKFLPLSQIPIQIANIEPVPLSQTDVPDLLTGVQACNAAWQNWNFSATGLERGDYWGHGGMPMTLFNTVATPNYSSGSRTYCGDSIASGVYSVYSNAASFHPGGVNALLADGHVQFVKNSISQSTWFSLGRSPVAR